MSVKAVPFCQTLILKNPLRKTVVVDVVVDVAVVVVPRVKSKDWRVCVARSSRKKSFFYRNHFSFFFLKLKIKILTEICLVKLSPVGIGKEMFVTGVLAVAATVAGGLSDSHRMGQLVIQTLD